MIQITLDVRALRRLLWLLVAVAVAMAALATVRSAWAGVDDPPLPTVAFVARADNPVDALAAAGVAGQLGAPVYLTFPSELGSDAAGGLAATDPDVVVLAGGPVALSVRVAEQVEALLPDAQVIRKEGGTRTSTAVALNQLPDELGFDRPVLTGATVTGDAGIAGELTVDGVQVAATMAELHARIASLEATLAGVDRNGDVLTFTGMNVQLVNGEGTTDTTNGLGNLIVGYNQQRPTPADRSGSHYVVVGDQHAWQNFGGVVTGLDNTSSGEWASVTGGTGNTAGRFGASVSGGRDNIAVGFGSSVSGGEGNRASSARSSVSGGFNNRASGEWSSVVGGLDGDAALTYHSLIGNSDHLDSP